MKSLRAGWQWCTIIVVLIAAKSYGQLHLPGGITIPDPRQPGQANRPSRQERPERPDPDRVCPKMIDWIGKLQSEYPGVDLGHVVSSRLQQMAVPLFADDVFQSEFGVSYPKLSDTERRDFFRTHVMPCQSSREYAQQTVVLQAFNTPFQAGTAGMGPLSPGKLTAELTELATARATLQGDEAMLQKAPASAEVYDQATGLVSKRKSELAVIWPSEKASFQAAVKDAVARSAAVAVQAKIQPLLDAPASPEAVRQLHEVPSTFAALFQSMPQEQRNDLVSKLENRRSAMLRELLPPQKVRADSFPATRQGLDDGAEWFLAYQPVFLQPPVLPEALAVAKGYISRREAVLAKMTPQFRQKVETSEDAEAVASMYDEVFRLPDDRQTESFRSLQAARSARAELLNKRAEQARLAAEEKAEKAALMRGELVASSLKVNNLTNAKVFRAIFVGDFAHAGIARADIFFVDMFGGYLEDFGETCKESLPPDKVMMTVKECVETQHWVNGYGMQTSPDTCVRWERHPTGVYADPRAFNAKVSLEDASQRNAMRGCLQVLTTPDPVGSAMGQTGDMVRAALSLKQDLPQLIAENGCSSKSLARFQENMTRFATGDDPVHAAGFESPTPNATRAQDLDLRALADDLIRANAAGWYLNRYGGLDGAAIDGNLDPQGRPRHVHATYDQKGVTNTGSVDIAFVDGVPSCLYFADDPTNCKAPSPSVVKRYEDGGYRKRKSAN
jgi:hypothetical protein